MSGDRIGANGVAPDRAGQGDVFPQKDDIGIAEFLAIALRTA